MTDQAEGDGAAGRRAVVVMARPLLRGAVKTRLARALGDEGALELYARLLRETLDQVERLPGAGLVLAVAPAAPSSGGSPDDGSAVAAPDTSADPPEDPLAGRTAAWRRIPQRGETLGERLAAVFAELFGAGAGSVMIVNSDSPAVPLEYLEQAFTEAAKTPRKEGGPGSVIPGGGVPGCLVLGPAADGGYYLIGLHRRTWDAHREAVTRLLISSPMSTASLLTYTLRAAQARGLRVAQLPLWVDVDEPADLGTYRRLSGEAPLRGEPLESLREIYLHITHRCGRDCRHCYNKEAAWDPGELTTAEWKDAIDQCAALGASSFVFIGGDPLLRPDIVELVGHITGTHRAKARFFFNSFVDVGLAADLRHAGRGLLRPLVSIDGPREINDELRGPGSYDDVMSSVANLLAVGLEPVANAVLVKPALPGLPQLARELRAAGVGRLHLILPHQAGGVAAAAGGRATGGLAAAHGPGAAGGRAAPTGRLDLVPTGAEMLEAVRALLKAADEVGLVVDNLPGWRRRLGARNDLCAAGCRDLAIDPYGNVHACVITAGDPAFVAGSLREQPLQQIWRASAGLRLLRAASSRDRADCLACPVADACGGECWVQAHYAARAHERPGGYAAPFPYCDLVRPMLEELERERDGAGAPSAPAAAPAGVACGSACDAGGGQASAGEADYSLFDCI